LLIRKAADELFAVSNRCAHMSCPLRNGKLEGYVLSCPCHDWRFDIRTGRFLDAPEIAIQVYETRIEEGNVWVKL
jgi:3-phenylpropionate/trans-cinnamate dioxygenase ferredoxin subunit